MSTACSTRGEGLDTQEECDHLAEYLQRFLERDDNDVFVLESQTLRVDQEGRFVDASTPGSLSPFRVEREHVQEFITFLFECGGFAIR